MYCYCNRKGPVGTFCWLASLIFRRSAVLTHDKTNRLSKTKQLKYWNNSSVVSRYQIGTHNSIVEAWEILFWRVVVQVPYKEHGHLVGHVIMAEVEEFTVIALPVQDKDVKKKQEIIMPDGRVCPDHFRGWLLKWTNYIKGYQRRWFVLSNGLLSYYR